MFRTLKRCRACHSSRLTQVFDLGLQPLANDFCHEDDDQAGYAPLRVLFCENCTLAQLSVVVDPKLLYRHYNYVTSQSDQMFKHFDRLAEDLHKENGRGSVLEIGSNDGTLLEYLKQLGFGPVLGIDPAENLSSLAMARGIETLNSIMTRATAEAAKNILGKVDTIIARHVFCHVDDWHEFLASCDSIAHDGTLLAIEVPYAGDLLTKNEFDTIYHEHTSYLTLDSVIAALRGTNLTLESVKRYPVHGGAVLLLIRKGKRLHQPVKDEPTITIGDWRQFAMRANKKMTEICSLIRNLSSSGKVVSGYGASAKSTVWIQSCCLTQKEISFISDTTPQKIGKCSPGTTIPIVDQKELMMLMPDYLVMFCWNFRDEVIEKNQDYLKAGGKFIVPSPELEIV